MESTTRPFFERALYLNPSARTFAYATFIGHGALLPGSNRVAIDPGAGAGACADALNLDFIRVPDGMQIYKKNVSICGFSAPSQIRVAQTPDRYLEDLMQNGLEECYPTKKNVSDFFQEFSALPQKLGFKDALQVERETCNVLSDKQIFLNKKYTITGFVDADYPEFEVNGLYKFNLFFIFRVDESNDKTISFDSPDGESIHYTQYGPCNLFDIDDVRKLSAYLNIINNLNKKKLLEEIGVIDEARVLTTEKAKEKMLLRAKYHFNLTFKQDLEVMVVKIDKPDREKTITTKDVFNIFKFLEVNIAYIIDTSCSNVSTGVSSFLRNRRLILPQEIGYGKKRKNRRSRRSKRSRSKRSKKRK